MTLRPTIARNHPRSTRMDQGGSTKQRDTHNGQHQTKNQSRTLPVRFAIIGPK